MSKLSDISDVYVFIHTTNENITKKVDNLFNGLQFKQFGPAKKEKGLSGIFYNKCLKAGNNEFFSIDKMNDLGDYELGSFSFEKSHQLDKQFDSLISYCFINETGFIAGNDYLAIFNHYYFHDKDTFICSNNMFAVAKLCNDKISEEAIFETLFFRFPFKKGTFFNNVKCLKPYQQLLFSEEGNLSISRSANFEDLILDNANDITTDTNHFFSQVKNPDNLPPLVTLSGGSDSTTILSILTKNGIKCQLASFKGHHDADTVKIRKLAKKTGFPYMFIDCDKYGDSQNDWIDYTFLTNGYSPSLHFYHFYKNLPEKYQIFDGYSVVLGDWSEAFLHFPYRDVIKGMPIDAVLNKYFSAFNPDFLLKMKEYLLQNYQDQLINVNTPEGLEKIRQYSLEFIPGRIVSRVYKCNTNFGHLNVSFFQSRKFISFVHKNNFGIASTCSARKDYPGYIGNRIPLGIIAHKMDKKINSFDLSYGLSLNDIYKNNWQVYLKKRTQSLKKKIYYLHHKIPVKIPQLTNINTSHFDFIQPGANLNFHTRRELSLFNSIYSIMEEK